MEIRAKDLCFRYPGGSPVFRDLAFELAHSSSRGTVIALMGRSGSGKTTLLRLIAGLESPNAGVLQVEPKLTRPPVYLFQRAVLLPQYSRQENAEYRQLTGRGRFNESLFKQLSAALELGADFLDSKRPMTPVSGGERQRLALVRDLSTEPELVLLDEPCVGLDPVIRNDFLLALRNVVESLGSLVIYVTHHIAEASLVADDIAFLDNSTPPTLHLRSTPSFCALPPTEDAALIVGSPTAFSIPVEHLQDSLWSISQDSTSADSTLVLDAKAVHPSPQQGLSVPMLSSNGLFALHRLPSGVSFLRSNHPVEKTDQLEIRGAGFLYSRATPPKRVSITTHYGDNGSCLNLE